MDAEELAFDDGTFDVALCALGLMYAPDPEKAVVEMHRVLKPGGRAVCAVWGERRKCGWAEIFPIVDARVQSEVCPMFFRIGTGKPCGTRWRRRASGDNQQAPGDPARLRRCRRGLRGGVRRRAGRAGLQPFHRGERHEAHKEYLASLEPYRKGDGYAVPGEFVIVAGKK